MFHEPIHVLGAGSIGLLWTASIRSKFPAYPITLLLRDHDRNRKRVAAAASENSSGIGAVEDGKRSRGCDQFLNISWNNRLTTPVKHSNDPATSTPNEQLISLPVQFIKDSNHEKRRIKTLIVATKAHQAKEAVESVIDRLRLTAATELKVDNDSNSDSVSSCASQIIVLCNGALSVREELSNLLLQHPQHTNNSISLTLATTTHGAYLSEPHRLVHAGVGTTFLEEQPTDGMVDLWNQAGLKCTALSAQNMNTILWNKLAANCVINPLTSLFRCTNGELLLEPSYPELREDILKEVADVAACATDTLTGTNGTPAQSEVETRVPTLDEMRNFVTQTIRDTRNNKSSMFQDIFMGQPQKTEIEHLNGYIVRKGKEMGKSCPANEDLCSRISELELQT